MKKRKTGRVNVSFEALQAFSRENQIALVADMTLTNRSAAYRCKNGTLTVCLCYRGADNLYVTHTFRGVVAK
jgi:membrane-bound inhibitor of C-type lysozyme